MDFAARGIVKTHFRVEKMEKLTDVSTPRLYFTGGQVTDRIWTQAFQDMKDAKLKGRVVIDLQ